MIPEQTENEPRIYMVPGLGADHRIFSLLRQQGLPIHTLEFIRPEPRESLRAYARRMLGGIDESRPFVLGGVSLGGIIAGEMAKLCRPEKLLLISTVKRSGEFPFYLHTFRYLPVQRLVSGKRIKQLAPREQSGGMSPVVRSILNGMREDADPHFVHWAVDAVVRWKRRDLPESFHHLHGDKDPLFPSALIRNHEVVKGGGHNIVLTHAEQVAEWMKKRIGMMA